MPSIRPTSIKVTGSRRGIIANAILATLAAVGINVLLVLIQHYLRKPNAVTTATHDVHEIQFQKIQPQRLTMPKPEKVKKKARKRKPRMVKTRNMKITNRMMPITAAVIPVNFNMSLDLMKDLNIDPPRRGADTETDTLLDVSMADKAPRPLVRGGPIYPPAARRLNLEGWVELAFVISETGTVSNVEVLDSSSRRFHNAAIDAATHWRFEPAIKDTRKVPVLCRSTVRFELE